MTVHIKPELEAIIAEDVKTSAYQSADDYVERAIEILHEQEEEFARERGEIAAQIEHGLEQAERGEFVSPDEVRERLREMRVSHSKPR